MVWFWVIVVVAILGAIVTVAVGRSGGMADVYDDRPDATIPTGRPLTAEDVRAVRFSTGFRGYRMDEVDALLERFEADRLARESHDLDQPTPGDPAHTTDDLEHDGYSDEVGDPDDEPRQEGRAAGDW